MQAANNQPSVNGINPLQGTPANNSGHPVRSDRVIQDTDAVASQTIESSQENYSQLPTLEGRPTISHVQENLDDDDDDDSIEIEPHHSPVPIDIDRNSPEFTLDKLTKIDTQMDELIASIDKVHTDSVAKAKELHEKKKIHKALISYLPKEELQKFEIDLKLKGERMENRRAALEKYKTAASQMETDPITRIEIDNKIKEIETKLSTAHHSLSDQLNFHSYTRIGHMLQKIAEMLHRMNEEMQEILNIRG